MIDKNIVKVLLFRKEILDTEPLEKKYGIALPPIFKSFYSIFEPYFAFENYRTSNSTELQSFTNLIYSSLKLDSYTHEHDEFVIDSFKELEELLTFEPSNKGYLKDLLFIANHGYWGGLMLGIGEHNCDKIYHNSDSKIVTFLANNIFELIQKMILVHQEIDEPWIDINNLYKNWGEDFWRIREDDNT